MKTQEIINNSENGLTISENRKAIENHKRAAYHFEAAAKCHHSAAKYHEDGDQERAALSTIEAYGHYYFGTEAQNEDLKYHATSNRIFNKTL